MNHVFVRMEIAAPQEQVFDVVSDHALFLTGPKSTCRIISSGSPEANGLGAIREVHVGRLIFLEEIVAFARPERFDYVITDSKSTNGAPFPLEHERGWMTFTPTPRGTMVEWHTRFSVTTPIVGWIMERIVGWQLRNGFREMLSRAKHRLESAAS